MILIAGAGIAGLSLGLTLHQIGVPFRIFEKVSEIKPLGVGINLQPNAIRELFDLGLESALEEIAVKTRDYGFYTKTGLEIWTEPRGTWAGYNWPQYSIHRGKLQMLLFDTLIARAGEEAVVTNADVLSYRTVGEQVEVEAENQASGTRQTLRGDLLIGADGIHSNVRKQMHPEDRDPVWGGAVMWRGTSVAKPFLSGASMILSGHDTQRFVAYPISKPNSSGKQLLNWIAELSYDPQQGWNKEDWNRPANLEDCLPQFTGWDFDWLNVPEIIQGAERVYEYPMVDRDPLESWLDGRVTLIGDAAHATYPVGSNGASQGILDARVLASKLLQHGLTEAALQAYDAEMRPIANGIVNTNRSGKGPDAIMQMVEDRCGGVFENIEDVMPKSELAAHAEKYKKISGFAIETLNARDDLIPVDKRVADSF